MADEPDKRGNPISYLALERNTSVAASDGKVVGVVEKVLAVEQEDIFDGLLVHTGVSGTRFVEAEMVGAIHEHLVELKIDAEAVDRQPHHNQGSAGFDADPAGGDWKPEQ